MQRVGIILGIWGNPLVLRRGEKGHRQDNLEQWTLAAPNLIIIHHTPGWGLRDCVRTAMSGAKRWSHFGNYVPNI